LALALAVGMSLAVGCESAGPAERAAPITTATSTQPTTGSRHWLGPAYWGNRLQDWRFEDGRFVCVTPQGWLPMRTIHDLTKQVTDNTKAFEASVLVSLDPAGEGPSYPDDAGAGMLVGVGNGQMDYRSAAIVHHWQGMGAGLFVGVDGLGQAFIVDNEQPWTLGGTFDASQALPRNNWKVSADSEESDGRAQQAIDGKPDTYWHTEFRNNKPAHPHELVIDLGESQRFAALAYLPRQDNDSGRVGEFDVYATYDKSNWGEPIASGKLPNTADLQVIELPQTSARYVKLVAKSAQRPQPSATVAEVFLLKKFVEPGDAPEGVLPKTLRLVVKGEPMGEGSYGLTVEARDLTTGALISTAVRIVDPVRVLGNLALVSHPGTQSQSARPALFGFDAWSVSGDAVSITPRQANSAILGTQYTLTDRVLKMTAQLMPLGDSDPLTAELQADLGRGWTNVATAPIVTPGWTATFRVEGWDDTKDTPFRVVYRLPDGGGAKAYTWRGTVRRDPVNKDKIVVAGFTGNHMNSRGIGRAWDGDRESESGNWVAGMYFPHADVTKSVAYHNPDLLFFSGDQVYEGGSPTFADRQNIELDYLYKWYLFVISYRDLMRDIPTVTIPDDHDVYQGNVWGQGGRKSPGRDHDGGYVHPASFVNMVHRTQTAHLPDPADPTPIDQDITYYTSDVKWGRVSFAVLADRMFKTGANHPDLPPSGTGRPDHYNNPAFDTADLDIDGMKLLGDRQLNFLEDWAGDWRGVDMKMALSQTVFANMATHHGGNLSHLIADLDSNGWPQTGRNTAIGKLRKAFALHLAGDQHLATLVHHGIDQHGDAIWSFCVPSVANFYPRAWAPEYQDPYRVPTPEDFLGQRLDGFKNKVTVYAATNPGNDMGHDPRMLHNGMPGYGIVVVDKANRAYEAQCWPRFADPSDRGQMYAGWPRTINQRDNYGRKVVGHLPAFRVKGLDSFVVKVSHQQTGELVYAMRIKGNAFKPFVFEQGQYAVTIAAPDRAGDDNVWTFTNLGVGEYDTPIEIDAE
jgi:hypothetical protein